MAFVGGAKLGLGAGLKSIFAATLPMLGRDAAEGEAEAIGLRLVGGRKPLNSRYAGQTYPLENLPPALQLKYPDSINFTPDGFPDFSP
jgi:hypothetical protein